MCVQQDGKRFQAHFSYQQKWESAKTVSHFLIVFVLIAEPRQGIIKILELKVNYSKQKPQNKKGHRLT